MSFDHRCMSCMVERGDGSVCPRCGESELEPDAHGLFLPPRTVVAEKYLLGKVLGHGGFGITYLGWDLKLERRLAVKEYFPREFATRATGAPTVVPFGGESREHFEYGRKKFLAEGRALVRFQDHPGIVSGLDFLEANGTAYLVMEYVEGRTLEAFLREWPAERLPVNVAVAVLMQVMDALRALHEEDLVHRDVSPDNVYITRTRQVKLLDFGSVRDALREHSHSIDVVVKHGYSPAEQYQRSGKIGPWTDVYAAAATLYRALVGRVPQEAIARMADDKLAPPSQLGVELPEAAEKALLAALAVHPSDRLRTIAELQQPLLELSGAEVPAVEPQEPAPAPADDSEQTERVASRPQPPEITEPVATGRGPAASPSSPPSEPASAPISPPSVPVSSPVHWRLAAFATLVLLLAVAIGWAVRSSLIREEAPTKGGLVLRLAPPAYATLDGHKTPDGGQRLAPMHRFTGLDARNYRLKVWRDGYSETRKKVSIRAGNTEELTIRLERP